MEPFEGCDDDFYDSLLLLNDKPYGGDVLDLSNSPFEECLVGDKGEFGGKDDEGFDEGFCEDGEMPQDDREGESRVPAAAPLDLQDLLDSDIPATALVQQPFTVQDDFEFDLGVDMLDMADNRVPLVPSLCRTLSPCLLPPSDASTTTLSLSSLSPHSDIGQLFEDTCEQTNVVCQQHKAVGADMTANSNTDLCPLDMCLTDYTTVLWDTPPPPPLSITSSSQTTLPLTITHPLPTTISRHMHGNVSSTMATTSSSLNPPPHKHSTPSPSTPSNGVTVGTSNQSKGDVPPKKGNSPPKIVEMPFYQFKKILECPDLPEQKKAEVKNMRRRGKNKMAAKNCRQRKLEVIMGLEQEVASLKEATSRLLMRKQSLENEIHSLKLKCLERTAPSVGAIKQELTS